MPRHHPEHAQAWRINMILSMAAQSRAEGILIIRAAKNVTITYQDASGQTAEIKLEDAPVLTLMRWPFPDGQPPGIENR